MVQKPDRARSVCIAVVEVEQPPDPLAPSDAALISIRVCPRLKSAPLIRVYPQDGFSFPRVRGRIRIFGIHLGTYHKRIRELGNDRFQLVVIHVYMTHRKPGMLFDLHFGEGYLLPGFGFEVPIVDVPAGKAVIGQSTGRLS